MNRRKLLKRLVQGSVHNVRFKDIMDLTDGFGFRLARVSGDHHILSHSGIPELLNLQSVGGQTKPYQVRQLLRLVERYDLELEEQG